ncbi:MAG: phenylalanine--tRNA ligase subunit alpha, partial [Alicyclobacillus sp.]|nr:phenylalanine--tRNA ligase subunit alpha [Alicyclobacillus sp.]
MQAHEVEQKVEQLVSAARQRLDAVDNARTLEEWRVEYLGKKSELSGILRLLGQLPAEDRPRVGDAVNRARQQLQAAFAARRQALAEAEQQRRFAAEAVDVTLPGRRTVRGALHPLVRTMYEIEEIFLSMGFSIAEGPEVETDEYNFEKLNLPKDHPARDMQDTFYITDTLLLRTHTSPMQVRTME